MHQYKYTFTIFTPAFKCEKTIHRVYESVINQTIKDFEWIIVDDASPDDLQNTLSDLLHNTDLNVTVLKHDKNKGKHIAWNLALEHAKGKFFLPADADDSFLPETLETFLRLWNEIPEGERNSYSGINVLCMDPYTKEIVGNKFPQDPLISNNLELKYKHKIIGEKWGVIRTKILKKYPFPDLKSSRGSYILSYVWFSIANEGYKVACHNVALRNYYTNDSTSIIQKSKKNPALSSKTLYHYLTWHLNSNYKYILKTGNIKLFLKDVLNMFRNGWLEKNSSISIYNKILEFKLKLIVMPFIPFFYVVYLLTYYKYR